MKYTAMKYSKLSGCSNSLSMINNIHNIYMFGKLILTFLSLKVIFLEYFLIYIKICLKSHRVTTTTTLNTSCSNNIMSLSARQGFLHACIFYYSWPYSDSQYGWEYLFSFDSYRDGNTSQMRLFLQ